jgi:hypothetical protein
MAPDGASCSLLALQQRAISPTSAGAKDSTFRTGGIFMSPMTALDVLGLLAILVAAGGPLWHGVPLPAGATSAVSAGRSKGRVRHIAEGSAGGDSRQAFGGGCGGDTRLLRATGFLPAA